MRILLLTALLSTTVLSHPRENAVVSHPEVLCAPDHITVFLATSQPFGGRMFVKGESDTRECVQREQPSASLKFNLPIGACGMRRKRQLDPRGVEYSFTLIVSFHPIFVTAGDRAFNVRCFYQESVKRVDAGLDVGSLSTEMISQQFAMPKCTYHIRDGPSGPAIRFAQVGDAVTHVWQCDDAAAWAYGLLVHSCFVDDGRGNRFELVDDRGCSVDTSLIPAIQYDGLTATANTHVFKYADKLQLFFTCTVQICFKHDGGCAGVTPPSCGAPRMPHPDALPVPHDLPMIPSGAPPSHAPPPSARHRHPESHGPAAPNPFPFSSNLPPEIAEKIEQIHREASEAANRHPPPPPSTPPQKQKTYSTAERQFEPPLRDEPLMADDADNSTTPSIVPSSTLTSIVRAPSTPALQVFHKSPHVTPQMDESLESSSSEDYEKEFTTIVPARSTMVTSEVRTRPGRALSHLEADVQAEVIVLPMEEGGEDGTPRTRNSAAAVPLLCLSRLTLSLIGALLLSVAALSAATAYLLAKSRNPQKDMV